MGDLIAFKSREKAQDEAALFDPETDARHLTEAQRANLMGGLGVTVQSATVQSAMDAAAAVAKAMRARKFDKAEACTEHLYDAARSIEAFLDGAPVAGLVLPKPLIQILRESVEDLNEVAARVLARKLPEEA